MLRARVWAAARYSWRLLVTGGTGVLVRGLRPFAVEAGHDLLPPTRQELDLFDPAAVGDATRDMDGVLQLATRIRSLEQRSDPEAWRENDRLRGEASRILVDAAITAGAAVYVQPTATFVFSPVGAVSEATPITDVAPILRSALAAERPGGYWTNTETDTAVRRRGPLAVAFGCRDWAVARDRFRAAHDVGVLGADDFFALAEAAWWLGEIDDSLAAFEQAYRRYLQAGQPRRAAMAAMFLAAHSTERGDLAIGSGWMGRVHRMLRDQPEGAEHGYPLYFDVFSARAGGDLDGAVAQARRMQEVGRRFGDPTWSPSACSARVGR